jgi:hypothetical protein
MDTSAYFDLMAVRTVPSGTAIHFPLRNYVSMGDSCSAITMQIATLDRPYLVALILTVDLDIRDRSDAINTPVTPESRTAKHTKLPMTGLIQTVADGI